MSGTDGDDIDFMGLTLEGDGPGNDEHYKQEQHEEQQAETDQPRMPLGPYSLRGGENGTFILHLAERDWVIGLNWVSYEERKPKSETLREAKEQNAQFVFRRDADESIQNGFSHYMKDTKKPNKLRSLAASIAEGTRQPWRGIYQISDNLWWYIAVRDGFAILPDSDVVGTLPEITAAMRAHQGMGQWATMKGDLADLEDLIANKATNSAKPVVVNQTKTHIYLFTLCVLVGLGITGLYLHHEHILQLKNDLQLLEKQRLIHKRIEEEKMLANTPNPATRLPMPNEMLQACWSKVGTLAVFNEGWELSKFSCMPNTLNVLWSRGPGATLYAAPSGGITKQGDAIESEIPLDMGKLTPDNTGDIQLAAREMQSLLQSAGIANATININIPHMAPIKQSDMSINSPPPPPPPPPTADITFTWPTFPVGTDWDSVPGLRIKSVVEGPNGWDVTAIIYGQREKIDIQ